MLFNTFNLYRLCGGGKFSSDSPDMFLLLLRKIQNLHVSGIIRTERAEEQAHQEETNVMLIAQKLNPEPGRQD